MRRATATAALLGAPTLAASSAYALSVDSPGRTVLAVAAAGALFTVAAMAGITALQEARPRVGAFSAVLVTTFGLLTIPIVIGVFVSLIGFFLFGIAAARGGAVPRRAGLLLAWLVLAGVFAMTTSESYGVDAYYPALAFLIGFPLPWLWLAVTLWRRASRPARRPT